LCFVQPSQTPDQRFDELLFVRIAQTAALRRNIVDTGKITVLVEQNRDIPKIGFADNFFADKIEDVHIDEASPRFIGNIARFSGVGGHFRKSRIDVFDLDAA